MEAPKRRYVMKIDIGADTLEDVAAAVADMAYTMDRSIKESGDISKASTSGGSTAGYGWILQHNPDMTHDRYFDELEEWRNSRKEV